MTTCHVGIINAAGFLNPGSSFHSFAKCSTGAGREVQVWKPTTRGVSKFVFRFRCGKSVQFSIWYRSAHLTPNTCGLSQPTRRSPRGFRSLRSCHHRVFSWEGFQFLGSTSELGIASILAPSGKMTVREKALTCTGNATHTHTHTHISSLEMMLRDKTNTTVTSQLTLTLGGTKCL